MVCVGACHVLMVQSQYPISGWCLCRSMPCPHGAVTVSDIGVVSKIHSMSDVTWKSINVGSTIGRSNYELSIVIFRCAQDAC